MLIDMTTIPATDLAYAAGVIDSDGCITVSLSGERKCNSTYAITVCVAQKDDEVPQWFLSMFGGKVRIIRRKGKWTEHRGGEIVYFPPTPRWEMYAQGAANFLEAILPYLKLKKLRAEAAIRLARMHMKRGRSKRVGYSREIGPEEKDRRRELAYFIRSENQKGNDRVAMTAKWGVN